MPISACWRITGYRGSGVHCPAMCLASLVGGGLDVRGGAGTGADAPLPSIEGFVIGAGITVIGAARN